MIKRDSINKLAIMGVFAALSVVMIMFIRIPLIPAAPYLTYDMADIPILLVSMLISPLCGLAVLGAVCVIQAFVLGGDGIIGFFMHFVASGAMVLIMGYVSRHNRPMYPHMVIAAVVSAVSMTAIMIPLNIVMTPLLTSCTFNDVYKLILPALLPFNLIKASANCGLALLALKFIKPVFNNVFNH